jgi:hypothetical protein
MSYNTPNSGSLQGLQMGQTLMVSARKVAGSKIQLEFAEVLEKESTAVNPLALFNKSDSRFSSGGARRAWLTVEPNDATALLGIDLTDSNTSWTKDILGREVLMLNVLNPQVLIGDVLSALKVEVVETTEPTEWQEDNKSTAAKRRGKDGDFCYHNGKEIYANTRIAFDKANHVFLAMDAVTAAPKLAVNDSPFN